VETDLSSPTHADKVNDLYRRVTRRVIPFLFVAYVIAIIDRINVGFAQLHMKTELGFSDAVYGLGAGIFFLGYVLFEVPSNAMLYRIGARKTFTRILVCWGLVSMVMATVKTPFALYALRFLLGVFEAGFFPGILFYLTYWFPASRRARATGWMFVAVTFSGTVGGVLSGAIMQYFEGVYGLSNWQWLFLIEGAPAVVLGVSAWFAIPDSPKDVNWLNENEKEILLLELRREGQTESAESLHSFAQLLVNPRILLLTAVYFTLSCGAMAISFWLPIMVHSAGTYTMLQTGLFSSIPYLVGMAGIVLITRHSDRTLERRYHYAACVIAAGVAFALLPSFAGNLPILLILLSIGVVGIFAGFPLFWSIPHRFLSATTAATGLALINSLGQIGGFVSPTVIGWVKTATGRMDNGLYLLAAVVALGGVALIFTARSPQSRNAIASLAGSRESTSRTGV
jgi:D-galactonate transporter